MLIPQRLLPRPNSEEFNFFQEDEPSKSADIATKSALPTMDANVDPTLVDALSNPKERMQVLQFEQQVLSFVNSRYYIICN